MTLYKDPMIYFFNMFQSNFKNTRINYGDIYRIKKYHKVFWNWDLSFSKIFIIYPEMLNNEVY